MYGRSHKWKHDIDEEIEELVVEDNELGGIKGTGDDEQYCTGELDNDNVSQRKKAVKEKKMANNRKLVLEEFCAFIYTLARKGTEEPKELEQVVHKTIGGFCQIEILEQVKRRKSYSPEKY